MAGTGEGGAIHRAFSHRDFRFLLGAYSISTAGDWLYGVAIAVYILRQTGSATWLAVAVIGRLLPYMLLSAVGGALADRYDRRLVMIVCDLARAGLMVALAVTAAASGPVAIAVGIAFLSSAASTPARPALAGIVPSLVGENDLAAANGVMGAVEHVAVALGPAVGAVLLALGSPAFAFVFNGATFLVSALLVSFVHSRRALVGEPGRSLGSRVVEGVDAIRSSDGVPTVVLVMIASSFLWGECLVLLPLVSSDLLRTGPQGLGYLYAAMGVGGIVGAVASGRLLKGPRSATPIIAALLLSTLPLAALAGASAPGVAYLLAALLGVGGVVLDVASVTLLQRAVREDVLSRVFGLLDSLAATTLLLGSLAAPALLGVMGLKWTLAASGIAIAFVALIASPRLRGIDRRAATRLAELTPQVDLLATVGLFSGAPRTVLEELAGSLEEIVVPAGRVVIREGDPADRVFVLRSGRVEVVTGSQLIATRGEGDYFGEIGVFERVPRTATVRTVTDCVIDAMDGEKFVRAVNRVPAVSMILQQGIVNRRTELVHLGVPTQDNVLADPERQSREMGSEDDEPGL